MTFANPLVLWLAGAAPAFAIALYLYDRARRRQLTRRLGELPVIGRVIASASPHRRAIKAAIYGVALGLVFVAVARPQREGKHEVEVRGLDLVVAVDASKSMLVDDVAPNRLARARALATALIDELPGDRVAPVVFAAQAARFPLTEDREVAARFLEDIGPADLPPGSNLAEVLRVGRCVLRPDVYDSLGCPEILGQRGRGHGGDPLPDDPSALDKARDDEKLDEKIARGRAIVLVTDGGDVDEDALKEVATARELGIAVIVVGVGSAQGGVVHEIDSLGRATGVVKRSRDGQTVVSKRDDAGMTKLAAAGGDPKRYLVAAEQGEADPTPIANLLNEVDRGLATKQVTELRDVYQPFLFAALMLLVIEAAIGTRKRSRA